jgi:hypothetical protein
MICRDAGLMLLLISVGDCDFYVIVFFADSFDDFLAK